ncbi:hypothetical protein GCM10009775_01520 [Microbacterium aoyamense]|uniref:PASTA domain-containing protein n=1 Tax=Microbacterium aoyamense TaxID=344166 RepID=A0ABP5AIR4_9MICO|nr:Ltp family lipoprotein [Microbacterium aoyamense]
MSIDNSNIDSNTEGIAPAGALPLPPAGWYPDPVNASVQRYWDGTAWVGAPLPATASPGPDAPAEAAGTARKRRLTWWQWALIAVGALVVLSILIGALGGGRGSTDIADSAEDTTVSAPVDEVEDVVETVEVPDLVGLTIADARAELDALGLVLADSEAGDDWVITAQQPSAGEHPLDGLELSVTSEAPKPVYTLEQQNALEQAQSYLDYSSFSRQGLIDQMSSEYGSGFPVEVSTWAADTVGADWNAEAVEAAQSYLDYSSFSRQGLYDQLTSQYGSQFTPEQTNHALAAVGY